MTRSVRRTGLGVAADMMHRYSAFIVVAVLLSGCISASVGRPFDAEARRQVRVNATTKEEVRRLFGEPDIVNSNLAGETWTYRYHKVTVEAFAGTTTEATPHQQVTIAFQNGVVVDCNYLYQEVTTGIVAGQLKKQITDKCVTPSPAVTSDKSEQNTAATVAGEKGSSPTASKGKTLRSTCPAPAIAVPLTKVMSPSFVKDYEGCDIIVEATFFKMGTEPWVFHKYDNSANTTFQVLEPGGTAQSVLGMNLGRFAGTPKSQSGLLFGLKLGDVILLRGAPVADEVGGRLISVVFHAESVTRK